MKKPNLFIVGAPRCGTTAWVGYLSEHPDIFFSPAKEPHFFCTDFPRFRWARTIEDYEALFNDAGMAPIVGEASVKYLYSSAAAREIHQYRPDAKILIFLRPHAEFLASYHNQLLYNRDETIADFAKAWRLSGRRRSQGAPPTCREAKFLDYKAVGSLAPQVRRYLDLFGRKQVKIVHYSSWTRDPRTTYLNILEFLGVGDDGRQDFTPAHGAKQHRSVSAANITQRPPNWVLAGARVIRRLTGRERLGAARAIRKLNMHRGYGQPLAAELRAEIEAYLAQDAIELNAIMAQAEPRA